jgi:hypothetical protein
MWSKKKIFYHKTKASMKMIKQALIQTQDTMIKGNNVTRLGEAIYKVRRDPQISDFKFHAKNKFEDSGYNKIYGT